MYEKGVSFKKIENVLHFVLFSLSSYSSCLPVLPVVCSLFLCVAFHLRQRFLPLALLTIKKNNPIIQLILIISCSLSIYTEEVVYVSKNPPLLMKKLRHPFLHSTSIRERETNPSLTHSLTLRCRESKPQG